MPSIDLHTHSTASDGTLTPEELVLHATRIGLKALALTDHDTLLGLDEGQKAAQEVSLEFIRGCELSVRTETGSMHIVGLWIPQAPQSLEKKLAKLQIMREARNLEILKNLRKAGIALDEHRLRALARGGSLGRPHFARLLVEDGIVTSMQDAFRNWLRPGTKGYAPKTKFSPKEGIRILKEASATVILAHPCTLRQDLQTLEKTLRILQNFGLDGMEVYYSMHTQAQTNAYADLCSRLDLLPSAGSDFHGTNKPNIALGTGKGGLRPPYALLEAMKAARARQGLHTD